MKTETGNIPLWQKPFVVCEHVGCACSFIYIYIVHI